MSISLLFKLYNHINEHFILSIGTGESAVANWYASNISLSQCLKNLFGHRNSEDVLECIYVLLYVGT